MKPAIIIGTIVVVIIIAVASYLALKSGTKSPTQAPAQAPPANVGDSINSVIDSQIEEIVNDVSNAAKEGYISRREYYTPGSHSVADFTSIVLKNIVGKPVKAIISRDDVSGVLKVIMTGVDPNVFEPSVSAISECVSDKLKTSTVGPRNIPAYAYDCTNDYFSENNLEFEKVAPAALTMYENAFNHYASEESKEEIKEKGGLKKGFSCYLVNGSENSPEFDSCMNGSETPKITWEHAKPFLAQFNSQPGPIPEGMQQIN